MKKIPWVELMIFCFGAILVAAGAMAAIHPRVEQSLISELRLIYPGAEVSLVGEIQWETGAMPQQIDQVRIVRDLGNGQIRFEARGQETSVGVIGFQAMRPAWVPVRRVAPSTTLKREYLKLETLNVATGMERELRGLMLPSSAEIESLETRQTLIEGQFVQLTQVQRVHDVNRGDPVQVRLKSGDVTLSTSGMAEEPSYMNEPVHVIIQKTKRSMAGRLTEHGVVEVIL